MGTIEISLNGEQADADDLLALSEQLQAWGYQEDQPLAVSIDGRLIPKGSHPQVNLAAGSRVEVFCLRQGG